MATRAVESRPSLYAGVFGECIGEFFGTMVLILFGDGCVATFALFAKVIPGVSSWVVIALGWGLAVMLGVYVAGTVSGAHLNPAVTLGLASRGKHPWGKVLPYMGSQLLGAFIAALILFLVYQGAIVNALGGHALNSTNVTQVGGVFYTSKKAFVGMFGAFGDEFVGTALLVGLIFAIVDVRNQPVQANLNPMIIGFLIVAIGLSFGLNSGYAINPARDFGPRLLITLVGGGTTSLLGQDNYFWIPIVAPLLGGVAGAYIYDFTIHKVLEARGLLASGASDVRGESVREPAVE